MSLFKETESKPKNKIKLIIDADSFIYEAAYLGHKHYTPQPENPLFKNLTRTLLEEQIDILNTRIKSVVNTVDDALNPFGLTVGEYNILLTPKKSICNGNDKKPNFRYELVKEYNRTHKVQAREYKTKRRNMQPIENLGKVFEYAASLPETIICWGAEADDYAYQFKIKDPSNIVLACKDKDLLFGIPTYGLGHYNYGKGEWVQTEENDANLFYYRQCLTGDNSDDITGLPGCGVKTAEKILPEWTNDEDIWNKVLKAFKDKGYDEDFALLQMRLVSLESVNEMFEVVMWQPRWIS